MATGTVPIPIQSTAGAIPVVNEKGEVSMQKVKVHRYVSGKRPDYAPASSSEDESSEDDGFVGRANKVVAPPSPQEVDVDDLEKESEDPRLKRLRRREAERDDEDDFVSNRLERHRHIHAPEVVAEVDFGSESEGENRHRGDDSDDEEEDLSEDEILRRRMLLRERMQITHGQKEEEIMAKEEEGMSEDEEVEETSEEEEETDSEEEAGPRLKPVFVRKRDRVTLIEKEREHIKQKQVELETKKMAEERRRHTMKMLEDEIRKESEEFNAEEHSMFDVNTDDENDEVEYEAWKLRELKRIKRDREERENIEKERMEIDRLRNMTEEERRLELRNNPKVVTNKAVKGKYKFLQKYYHRGAFFMDRSEDVYTRDFSAATLEDHFDKSILPKVMQVKNFGRSGRTKYTHLVDQDTTAFDSPWVSETAQNLKFHHNQAGGMKQGFEKPGVQKRKK